MSNPYLITIEPLRAEFTPQEKIFYIPDWAVTDLRRMIGMCQSSDAVQHNHRNGFKPDAWVRFNPEPLTPATAARDELMTYPTTEVVMTFLRLAAAAGREGA